MIYLKITHVQRIFFKAEKNLVNNENITQKLFASSGNTPVVLECKSDDSSNKNCNFLNVANNSEIYNIIKDNIKNIYDSEKGESQIIQGEDNIKGISNMKYMNHLISLN